MGRQLRRVPLDFQWPMGEVWSGFLNPHWKHRRECAACDGQGSSPAGRRLRDQWYGHESGGFDPVAYGARPIRADDPEVVAFAARNVDRDPVYYRVGALGRDGALAREARRLWGLFRGAWSHHLVQADVDALVAAGRLWDLTRDGHTPTADEVNAWSLRGMGHDSINQWVCCRARAEREGIDPTCAACAGHGSLWESPEHEAAYEAWTPTGPPEGEGWQVWETVTEGSPISPVFGDAAKLADWLARNRGDDGTFDQWMKFLDGPGWAPSMVGDASGIRTGVEAVGS